MTISERKPQVLAPAPKAVQQHVERALASTTFSAAPRISQFLRFVVERTLEGAEDELKEYTIGVEVFDRGKDFDPRIDTLVRVQGRRLRKRLEEYYRAEGRSEPVRIEIPKGGYAPRFRLASNGDVGSEASAERHGLPIPRTSLIGREADLESLGSLLRQGDTRLVTVTGVGGSGKTRFAVEAGWQAARGFLGGVFFTPLASAQDLDAARAALAKTFGLSLGRERSIAQALLQHLGSNIRVPTLLLLDNLEHLEGAGALVSELLDACPSIKVLAASRSALRIYGEREFSLLPLEAPREDDLQSVEALRQNPAVQLFLERAKAVNRTVELDEQNAKPISEICRRLDGLPLAIELAAAHSRTLPPTVLRARLKTPLDLLGEGPRDVPARQQTLRATLDWSYSLLTESEQRFFRRLSVLPAGCTPESAEAVADAYCDLGVAIPASLDALVGKNLMHCVDPLEDEPRFAMLRTVREYGLEKLEESGEGDKVRRALAAYTIVLGEEVPSDKPEAHDRAWVDRCEAEYPNMASAVEWLIERKHADWASRACLGLFRYWERRYFFTDGRKYFEALLQLPDLEPQARALATSSKASLVCLQGDVEAGLRLYQDGLTLFREIGDWRGVAREANGLAVVYRRRGELARAEQFFGECLEACRKLSDEAQIASILSNLADIASRKGEAERARHLIGQAVETFSQLGHLAGVAWSLSQMGDQARRLEDFDAAEARYRQALEVFEKLGDCMGAGRTLQDLAELACAVRDFTGAKALFESALERFVAARNIRGISMALDRVAGAQECLGRPSPALTLAGAASSIREHAGAEERPWSSDEHALREQTLESARAQLDGPVAEDAWETGREMELAAALMYVRSLDWDSAGTTPA